MEKSILFNNLDRFFTTDTPQLVVHGTPADVEKFAGTNNCRPVYVSLIMATNTDDAQTALSRFFDGFNGIGVADDLVTMAAQCRQTSDYDLHLVNGGGKIAAVMDIYDKNSINI